MSSLEKPCALPIELRTIIVSFSDDASSSIRYTRSGLSSGSERMYLHLSTWLRIESTLMTLAARGVRLSRMMRDEGMASLGSGTMILAYGVSC